MNGIHRGRFEVNVKEIQEMWVNLTESFVGTAAIGLLREHLCTLKDRYCNELVWLPDIMYETDYAVRLKANMDFLEGIIVEFDKLLKGSFGEYYKRPADMNESEVMKFKGNGFGVLDKTLIGGTDWSRIKMVVESKRDLMESDWYDCYSLFVIKVVQLLESLHRLNYIV